MAISLSCTNHSINHHSNGINNEQGSFLTRFNAWYRKQKHCTVSTEIYLSMNECIPSNGWQWYRYWWGFQHEIFGFGFFRESGPPWAMNLNVIIRHNLSCSKEKSEINIELWIFFSCTTMVERVIQNLHFCSFRLQGRLFVLGNAGWGQQVDFLLLLSLGAHWK